MEYVSIQRQKKISTLFNFKKQLKVYYYISEIKFLAFKTQLLIQGMYIIQVNNIRSSSNKNRTLDNEKVVNGKVKYIHE